MRKIRDVLVCAYDKEVSERETSMRTGVSRRTISEYKRRFMRCGLPWPIPPDIDDDALEVALYPGTIAPPRQALYDIDFATVHLELRKKGATLAVLHEEWLQAVPQEQHISYSQYCRRYNDYKNSLRISLRQRYTNGELALVDYAGPTIEVTDCATGEVRAAQIFIGVLGGSNYTFCEATWSQKSRDWIESHCRMFEFFGGVPAVVVHDNLKSAVTRADRLSPVMNDSYQAVCRYYGTHPFAARAYRPKDKAKAEVGVLIVERWILFRLRKRKFFSLAELNQAIKELLTQLNLKPFQKLPGSRFGNWIDSEKASLQPLPDERYEYAEWGKVRAGIDYHATIDAHAYSVPYQLRGEEFEFRLTATSVDLLLKGKCVATHVRSYEPGKSTTLPAHRSAAHTAFSGWTEDNALQWAQEIGPATHAVMADQLAKINNDLFGYRTTQAMKKLVQSYGKTRVEEANAYAHIHGLMRTHNLRNILSRNLDKLFAQSSVRDEADQTASIQASAHENIRGANYYEQILDIKESEKP